MTTLKSQERGGWGSSQRGVEDKLTQGGEWVGGGGRKKRLR